MQITANNVSHSITAIPKKAYPVFMMGKVKFGLSDLLQLIPNAFQHYKIPELGANGKYLIPVSGGADSTALAIILHLMFPSIDFELFFTDTLAEDSAIYESLDALEVYLGKRITRIIPRAGLYDLIDQFNGYLPSTGSRYCTRLLKLAPFEPWLERYSGQEKVMFVGIRSDEDFRIGFSVEGTTTEMPLLDMFVTRQVVFEVLRQTIGISRLYRRRTRSGCGNCFFQRRSELVGLYQEARPDFEMGQRYEKLDPINEDAYPVATALWSDSGIAQNWLSLPLPNDDDKITGKVSSKKHGSLFGERGIFIGAEFFTDGMYAVDEFIWHQRIVSYSPTMAGIRRQLDDRYKHLLATGEVFDMSPDNVRNQVKFAIYYIELPESVFNPDGPKGNSYTWQQNSSYQQLRHIIEWSTRVLNAEQLRKTASVQAHPLSIQYEWAETSKEALKKVEKETGTVVSSQWYKASEVTREVSVEEEARGVY